MPAKVTTTTGVSAADVDAKLPKTFFVMRGHVMAAFGFTGEEMSALVAQRVFLAKYPLGKTHTVLKKKKEKVVQSRMRFVRSQVLEVAKRWEETEK